MTLESARKAARAAHEKLYYTASCDIIEYRDIFNGETSITEKQEVAVYESVPCNLSFEDLDPAVYTDTGASITQGVKLFLSPDITVKSGCKITVMQNGVTTAYAASGVPAVYSGHQEIMLKLFEKWA